MMNRMLFLLTAFLAIWVFAGCASTKKPDVSSTYYPVTSEELILPNELKGEIGRANELFSQGEYRTASKIYSQLLGEYRSSDGSFETALLTNICLGYLEQGERNNFKSCAGKLNDAGKDLPYLSRETQLVIQINNSLEGLKRTENDLRIESRMADGITESLKEEK